MERKLEICCTSFDDALTAERGGADRIELCEELWLGGVTPDDDLIAVVIEAISVPVFVLVRPRGGDFVYDDDELREMVQTIAIVRDLGAAGIVSGALTRKREIDLSATRALMKAARGVPFTFHRAFDAVADQGVALEQLRELGVDRVLTAAAADHESDAPILLACGGLRAANIASVAENSTLREFHSAARTGTEPVEEAEVSAMAAVIHEI